MLPFSVAEPAAGPLMTPEVKAPTGPPMIISFGNAEPATMVTCCPRFVTSSGPVPRPLFALRLMTPPLTTVPPE